MIRACETDVKHAGNVTLPRAAGVMLAVLAALVMMALNACPKSGTAMYRQGQVLMADGDYQGALDKFDKGLQAEPESRMLKFAKARALYELKRFDEALPLLIEFLAATEQERVAFSSERFDAEFYRDKCLQELGEVVEQNPEAIPPPRMGE